MLELYKNSWEVKTFGYALGIGRNILFKGAGLVDE